ncbi:hypothetical protein TSOC_010470, partial [Tetrabaena socialis]
MDPFYSVLFCVLALVAVALNVIEWRADYDAPRTAIPGFVAFRNNYLLVYSLMM